MSHDCRENDSFFYNAPHQKYKIQSLLFIDNIREIDVSTHLDLGYAELTVTTPNRSGRAIKLNADGQHYRLSCYGFDGLCAEGNIGRTIRAEQVRTVLRDTVGKGFLNGVLLEYRNSGSIHTNKEFAHPEGRLIEVLAQPAIFSLKLGILLLLPAIFLRLKRM